VLGVSGITHPVGPDPAPARPDTNGGFPGGCLQFPARANLATAQRTIGRSLSDGGASVADCHCQACGGDSFVARSARPQSLTELVPTITLIQQWEMILAQGGPWLAEPSFLAKLHALRPRLAALTDAPVFTNGDYQPGNFLTDGEQITGFVDFEYASFQDYLYGFAKYPIYDLHPLNKGGIIEHLLAAQAIAFADFAPRLALGCLATLRREIPVRGGDAGYRAHVLALLDRAFGAL